MRIGEVIGKVTLGASDPMMVGGRMLIVQPFDPPSLRDKVQGGEGVSTSEPIVAYDQLGAGIGHIVGFSEGREAAMPFYPDRVAIDAYICCLLDRITYTDRAGQACAGAVGPGWR